MQNPPKMSSDEKTEKPVFKSGSFQNSRVTSNKKTWRSLKQVITLEKQLPWPQNFVHYSSINAPPSFRPARKYSDISGLLAPYTDPHTKLHFASADEYATVIKLPSDIISGYLNLRGATSAVG